MPINNGYTTLANVKALLTIGNVNAADDAVLERMIEQASRRIDQITRRTFYARTETRSYDVPGGRELWLDDDLLTITSLKNGDGSTIAETEYYTYPKNCSYAWMIKLKQSSSVSFVEDADGNDEGVIEVEGTWGYSAAAPMDIQDACESIVTAAYRNRYGTNVQGTATITAAGVVITPQDVPADAMSILSGYRRLA